MPLYPGELQERTYVAERLIAGQVYQEIAKNRLDAIIMPGFVTPAPLHGEAGVS